VIALQQRTGKKRNRFARGPVEPENIAVARRLAMMKIVATIAVSACAAGFSDTCAAHRVHLILPGEVAPGVYGRVDVGDGPQPPLLNLRPVTVVRTHRRKALEPVYLHVPPAHAAKWSRYCYKYRACHLPVFFVRSSEYGPLHRRVNGNAYAEARH
jgi:hypothetical protein